MLISHDEMVDRLNQVIEECSGSRRKAAVKLGYKPSYASYLGRIVNGKDLIPEKLGKRLGATERKIMFEIPSPTESKKGGK